MSAPRSFPDVFCDELAEVCPEIRLPPPEQRDPERVTKAVDTSPTEISALCLSGGGIRSASFALGILQTLAKFELLGQFHYLSTVSGGGYIGSWLSTWRCLKSDRKVFSDLNKLSSQQACDPDEIAGIRRDSNYITPRLGLLSADTWTVLTLYFRNLILNWLIFVPFFVGCLLFPDWWEAVLCWFERFPTHEIHYGVIGLGGALLLTGLTVAIYGRFRMQGEWLSRGRFLRWVLAPLVLSTMCFCIAVPTLDLTTGSLENSMGLGLSFGVGIYFIAWLIGRVALSPSPDSIDSHELVAWVLSGGVVGFLVGCGVFAAAHNHWLRETAVLGISACVSAYLIGDILYVGASSFRVRGDLDREWLARASGWLGAVAVLWSVTAALVLYGLDLLEAAGSIGHRWTTAVGGVAGLVTLILGSSEKTGANPAAQALKRLSVQQIASIAAVVFAVVLAVLLAGLGQWAIQTLESSVRNPPWAQSFPLVELGLLVTLIAAAFVFSFFVNVNRFSLHSLYRNRISRAFIGSARATEREPDPFTGFDPKDNVCLAKVVPQTNRGRLFHVINATLNVVSPKNTAWQQRKAESFVFTRLGCGNPIVGFRPTNAYAKGKGSDGITLATAMAISGAAVSPNQGYNSSPLIGLLLMLFNVRLGWWLGNPKSDVYNCEGPKFGITPALRELAGATTDTGTWIYLSDGGHFENLGLYEMIRRRCRFVLVSDAGCDPKFTFDDLGNAVRKICIDQGVRICFKTFELKPRQTPPTPGVRYAIGSIVYPGDARPGWLLYIKPTYQGTESLDVCNYANQHETFPHESTVDQWFSESQLESYRALGALILEDLCTKGGSLPKRAMTLEDLRSVAEDYLPAQVAAAWRRSVRSAP
jgi:Patatin-like phospholipase